jgi:hypothetical protein
MAYKVPVLQDEALKFHPGIKTIPMVSFRECGSKKCFDAEFETIADAQLYVDQRRAVAALDKEGKEIPGKYSRISKWDWFIQYVVWVEEEAKEPKIYS